MSRIIPTVLVCGTGPSLDDMTDSDIEQYDITVGCNYIYKRFTPDYLCVTDIVAFFEGAGGWDLFNELKTIWVFPSCTEKMFTFIPEHVKVLFISPPKRVYNTLFDLAIPLANEISKDIDICGIGGVGHFYEDPESFVAPRPSMPVYKDVFELYKQYKNLNINILHEVE